MGCEKRVLDNYQIFQGPVVNMTLIANYCQETSYYVRVNDSNEQWHLRSIVIVFIFSHAFFVADFRIIVLDEKPLSVEFFIILIHVIHLHTVI